MKKRLYRAYTDGNKSNPNMIDLTLNDSDDELSDKVDKSHTFLDLVSDDEESEEYIPKRITKKTRMKLTRKDSKGRVRPKGSTKKKSIRTKYTTKRSSDTD